MSFSCIIHKIKSIVDKHIVNSYARDLDRFILSNNPQNNSDVERLMFEYANRQKRNTL